MDNRGQPEQPEWNALTSVVDVVRAPAPETAAADFAQRLGDAGFCVYDGSEPDVFESEPLPEDTEVPRARGAAPDDPVWNVLVAVVDTVEAGTASQAGQKLSGRLTDAGFEPYPEDEPDVFLSDDSPVPVSTAIRVTDGTVVDCGTPAALLDHMAGNRALTLDSDVLLAEGELDAEQAAAAVEEHRVTMRQELGHAGPGIG